MSKSIAVLGVSILVPSISLAAPSNEMLWEEIQALKSKPATESAKSGSDLEVAVGGFVRADVGFGDRYGDDAENDHIGISKAALATVAKYGNNSAVLVIGTEVDSDPSAAGKANGKVGVKDAFIVLDHFLTDSLKVSLGAQPLLVGLKPNGYPGDRSINSSIEYGANGAFPVSNQAGPSVVANFTINDSHALHFGVFDKDNYNYNNKLDEYVEKDSAITDNVFIQWRGTDIAGSGLYAALAYEMLYIGGEVNDTDDIIIAGAGWKNDMFDVSFEYNMLGANVVRADDDESYMMVETTYNLSTDLLFYLDYSVADQLDVTTIRVGTSYDYSQHVVFSAEFAMDDFGESGEDTDSLDLRVSYNF